MGFWGDFGQGAGANLISGVQGADLSMQRTQKAQADLQDRAMEEKRFELQQQAAERQLAAQEQQAEQSKLTALLNVTKIGNPKMRKAALTYLAPTLKLDTKNPTTQALIDAMGQDDPDFINTFRQAATEMGLKGMTVELISKTFQDRPDEALNMLVGMAGKKQAADLESQRIALAGGRLDLAASGQELSRERFTEQQEKDRARMAGEIPPMGYAPGDQPGTFKAIPGGPATLPTEPERKSAEYYNLAAASERDGTNFAAKNPEYLNSAAGWWDQATGALIPERFQAYAKTNAGLEFKAAWAPFINARLRRETGAVITNLEWNEAMQRFIPLPTDGPDVVAQKARNRQEVLAVMKESAGRAIPGASGQPGPAPAAPAAPSAAPQRKALPQQGEDMIRALGQKYRAGQASAQEVEQLKALLRAKGF